MVGEVGLARANDPIYNKVSEMGLARANDPICAKMSMVRGMEGGG